MGVPALFRWLSQKYPKIISPVIEEKPAIVDGNEIPVDTTKENPNGEEMDNLYLDMNGIVHPCSHPEDRPPPSTEAEMMFAIFKYTDRVVNMARPRKLLMIAVDGVAPRAKMNQQRSRRFRSAREAKEKDEDKEEMWKLLKQQNGGVLPDDVLEESAKKTWDSNAITPGTPFMDTLAVCLRYWIAYKLNTDPAWEKLKIIISDATVPGEGEHKIMEFIRSQRSSPEHDPNTRHVIYGLDADLIMLGLATHEPHFRVLREDVFAQDSKPKTCRRCGQVGHFAAECKGELKPKQGEFDEKGKTPELQPFIWLNVSVLREYLEVEMDVTHSGPPSFEPDLERALDDWVFMCFFVGNDFLPHLPSLDIREQGIDTLIAIWRDNVREMGGYVTKDGYVELERVQRILAGLAKQEDAIFQRRKQEEDRREASAKRRRMNNNGNNDDRRQPPKQAGDRSSLNSADLNLMDLNVLRDTTKSYRDVTIPAPNGKASNSAGGITHDQVMNRGSVQNANQANKSAAAVLKERLLGKNVPETQESTQDSAENDHQRAPKPMADAASTSTPPSASNKRKRELQDEDESATPGKHTPDSVTTPSKTGPDEPAEDTVKLWESGYADRYYEQKFQVDPENHDFRHEVARAYVEGLAWVLLYYMQGCPSWTWYYPYHYAPFAADFAGVDKTKFNFEKGKPFRAFEQLMGVLPAASNHAIPHVFRSLMTDEDSDIVDFYPEEFPIDLNGKKMAWQGVALLPFIDEKRLLKAMEEKYPLLSEDEIRRNEIGHDVLLFTDRHPMYEGIAANFYSKVQGVEKFQLSPRTSEGLAGKVAKNEDYIPMGSLTFPLPEGGMPDLDEDRSISVHYELPKSSHIHKSMILRGVKFSTPMLDKEDKDMTRGRSMKSGRSYGGVPLRGDHRGGRGGRGGGRGGQINYNASAPGSQPAQPNRENPFAGHLNPAFFPNGFPPPPMPNANGWVPPPPGNFGAGPMPPMPHMPQQGWNNYGYQQPPQYQHQQPYGSGYGPNGHQQNGYQQNGYQQNGHHQNGHGRGRGQGQGGQGRR